MALFTDGTISTLEELRDYESAIYDLASTECIDLSRKLVLAQQELEVNLITRLFRDSPEQLSQVVITPALRLWHTFHTLALVYRDAYNSHINDRYQGKWKEYERLAVWAYTSLFQAGVGMTDAPVPKAEPPVLSTAAGSAEAAMYWVRAAWIGQTGEEGCPSDPAVLSAPQGAVLVAAATAAPANATGWNVYAGLAAGDTRLQNSSPIAVGAQWVMPDSGLVNGRQAGSGQSPSSYKRIERVFERG